MSTDARLRLIEARQRLRDLRNREYGPRHVLAGDESGNVEIPGTDLILARVSATGRPIIAFNPSQRELGWGQTLDVYPMGETAPAGWYVPQVREVLRTCALYTGVANVQYMESPTFTTAFVAPNVSQETEQVRTTEVLYFGLRVLNGDAYVLDIYDGRLMRFDTGGAATPLVRVGGHPQLARTFSADPPIIPIDNTAPWSNTTQFDVGPNGRIYFDRLSGSGTAVGTPGTYTSSIYSCDLSGGDEQLIATTGAQGWTQAGAGAIFVAYSAYDDTVYWGWNDLNTNHLVIRKYQGGSVSVVGGLATEASPSQGVPILNKTLLGGKVSGSTSVPFTMATCDPVTGRLFWASYTEAGIRTIHGIDRDGIYLAPGAVFNGSAAGPAGSLAISTGCNRPTLAAYSRFGADPFAPYQYAITRSGVDQDTGETGANQPIIATFPNGDPAGIPSTMIFSANDLYNPYFHAMDANGSSDTIYWYAVGSSEHDAARYGSPGFPTIGKQLLTVT